MKIHEATQHTNLNYCWNVEYIFFSFRVQQTAECLSLWYNNIFVIYAQFNNNKKKYNQEIQVINLFIQSRNEYWYVFFAF